MTGPRKKGDVAFKIFTHARHMDKSAALLESLMHHDPDFMMPSMMLRSFIFEIYLKCLIVLESGGDAPRGHDYLELFKLVSETSKAKIQSHYAQNPSVMLRVQQQVDQLTDLSDEQRQRIRDLDLSFYAVLKNAKNSFRQLRYIYEDSELDSFQGFTVETILLGVVERIKELRPNWFLSDPHWNVGPATSLTR
jgi:hypothetical protein